MKRIDATRQEIIDDMIKVYNQVNKLTTRTYAKYGKYATTVYGRIDSFNNLKQDALAIKVHKNNISKEEITKDIYLVAEKFPFMTRDVYIKNGNYSRKPIDRHFGSWNNMLIELGLNINCLINIPEKDLLQDLKDLYEYSKSISATIVKHHGKYSVEVYQRRFGSFNNALLKAGLPLNNSSSPTAYYIIKICESILGEKAIIEKQFDWLYNEETNKPLYIDAYFESFNLAFEYDGPQHKISIPNYGGEEALARTIYLDNLKNKLLKDNKVNLVRLSHDEPHNRTYLESLLSVYL